MKDLKIFNYEQNEVRTVMIESKIQFVAKDVCRVLKLNNISQATQNLDDDEKGIYKIDTLGGLQDMLCVSESGLYALIIRSKKPNAKKFRKWVTSEVIPNIMRTGKYITKQQLTPIQISRSFKGYVALAKQFGFDENQSRLRANKIMKNYHNIDCMELLEFTHLEYDSKELYFTPTELGKRFNMSGQGFNLILQDIGLQIKHDKRWIPTETGKQYIRLYDTNKAHSDGTPVQQMKWSDSVVELLTNITGINE